MLLILIVLSFMLEFAMFSSLLWGFRKQIAYSVILLTAISAIWGIGLIFLYGDLWIFALYIALFSFYRAFNMARIIKARMHAKYLHAATFKTSIALFLLSILGLIGTAYVHYNAATFIELLFIFQLPVALVVFLSVSYNIRLSRRYLKTKDYSDAELPTLTVCIPARNETNDLEQCLQALLASTYPKLEILVLDDCSQDKTADIIKSFAQDGVRFIIGAEPEPRWLAKNQAYQRLAAEATGEYLLFCGVDTRFSPNTLRELVITALANKQSMIAVLPRRTSPDTNSAIIQPMRYWWELAPPRWLSHRPPVLSTCWLINHRTLNELGGFSAVSHMLLPESYFAKQLDKHNEYSFISCSDTIDVQTVKTIQDQRDTALRTQYPKIRRRPELALLLTLFDAVFLLGPFILVLVSFWFSVYAFIASVFTCLLLIASHIEILRHTDSSNVPIGLVNYPLVVLTEIYFGYASMFGYEFGNIEWKGRNVCIPVMHVIPKLPSLDNNLRSKHSS